ncbi:uncharacterized protein [Antedon mediterranea]|uniref:uncharacterized protein isoform X2 n=1 Tax=Antedon mediterranea TaxID=105859 RepID=UPI003AF5391D
MMNQHIEMFPLERNFVPPPYSGSKMKMSFRQTFTLFTGGTMVVSGMLIVIIGLEMIWYLSQSTADHGVSPLIAFAGLLVAGVGIGNLIAGVQMSAKRSQRSVAWISMVANLFLLVLIGASIALVTYDVYDYLEDTANNADWQYIDQMYTILTFIFVSLLLLIIISLFTECCVAIDPFGGHGYPQPGYGHGGYPGPYKY